MIVAMLSVGRQQMALIQHHLHAGWPQNPTQSDLGDQVAHRSHRRFKQIIQSQHNAVIRWGYHRPKAPRRHTRATRANLSTLHVNNIEPVRRCKLTKPCLVVFALWMYHHGSDVLAEMNITVDLHLLVGFEGL